MEKKFKQDIGMEEIRTGLGINRRIKDDIEKGLEVVRLDLKEKDIYRAFVPDKDFIANKITKEYIESHIELKVKKILKTEKSETRFGHYVYFKGGNNG